MFVYVCVKDINLNMAVIILLDICGTSECICIGTCLLSRRSWLSWSVVQGMLPLEGGRSSVISPRAEEMRNIPFGREGLAASTPSCQVYVNSGLTVLGSYFVT